MRVIVVEWHDAGSGHTKEEAEQIYRHSVGYEVANEQGHGITIAMESDQLSGVHFIPWGMVRKVTCLTPDHGEGIA